MGPRRGLLALFAATVALAQSPPMRSTAVGHETRQDDWPAIAAARDGTLWAAWVAYDSYRSGRRPRAIALRDSKGRSSTRANSAMGENDTRLLFEELRLRNAISIPHTIGTNEGSDWRDSGPAIEPVVEIFQGLRTSYEAVDAPFDGG